jgi:hypothetical protein
MRSEWRFTMKLRAVTVFAAVSIAFSGIACAMPDMKPQLDATAPKAAPIAGKILEFMNSSGYTYLLIEDADGFKDWVAIPELFVTVGDEVELQPGVQMGEFKSKQLNKTFDKILFSGGPTDKYNEKRKVNAHKGADMSEPAPGKKKTEGKIIEGLKVKKATGDNAYTIAEILEKRDALQDKTIMVSGQVVKVSTGIMNRNWVHIKDGSGENGANKLVVTTKDSPETGEVVTFSGVFHNNVDFGGGYQYAVILENASIKQ